MMQDMSMSIMDQFKVNIQGGSLELMIPIPDPKLPISWLKEEFRLRAEKRGKNLIVDELSYDGYLVDDVDAIWDVLSDECRLVAIGPGIEPPPMSARSCGVDESGRTKRKYTRGGHKKLKVVAHVLEAHLPEMMQTAEKERQRFYAKMVALPQMMAADVNRDEIVSWYKRARKKSRGGEDDGNEDDNSIDSSDIRSRNNSMSQNNSNQYYHNALQSSDSNGVGGMDYVTQLSMNPTLDVYSSMNDYGSLDNQNNMGHHQTHHDGIHDYVVNDYGVNDYNSNSHYDTYNSSHHPSHDYHHNTMMEHSNNHNMGVNMDHQSYNQMPYNQNGHNQMSHGNMMNQQVYNQSHLIDNGFVPQGHAQFDQGNNHHLNNASSFNQGGIPPLEYQTNDGLMGQIPQDQTGLDYRTSSSSSLDYSSYPIASTSVVPANVDSLNMPSTASSNQSMMDQTHPANGVVGSNVPGSDFQPPSVETTYPPSTPYPNQSTATPPILTNDVDYSSSQPNIHSSYPDPLMDASQQQTVSTSSAPSSSSSSSGVYNQYQPESVSQSSNIASSIQTFETNGLNPIDESSESSQVQNDTNNTNNASLIQSNQYQTNVNSQFVGGGTTQTDVTPHMNVSNALQSDIAFNQGGEGAPPPSSTAQETEVFRSSDNTSVPTEEAMPPLCDMDKTCDMNESSTTMNEQQPISGNFSQLQNYLHHGDILHGNTEVVAEVSSTQPNESLVEEGGKVEGGEIKSNSIETPITEETGNGGVEN